MANNTMWMVRAARGGVLADEFRENGVVAIGWKDVGDLSAIEDRKKIIELVQQTYLDHKPKQNLVSGSQIYRFRSEIKVGDRVVTYDPSRRVYLVGTVSGGYRYEPSLIEELPNVRAVEWQGSVDRDSLSVSTRNSLGAISTLFQIPASAAEEIESLLRGSPIPVVDKELVEAEEEEDLLKEIQSRSHEFIKDEVSKLDWEELQELVAGVLRGMGYKTQVSAPGSDRGKDIIASPDGFGFEQPRIVVEVKHRKNQTMGSQEIRSFIGGRHKDDKGLYVSTGGFTKDARYEAERAPIPVMLMDLDDLVSAIVEHYDSMDAEAKALIRLTRVYWPA